MIKRWLVLLAAAALPCAAEKLAEEIRDEHRSVAQMAQRAGLVK